jgi:hypothetical protein
LLPEASRFLCRLCFLVCHLIYFVFPGWPSRFGSRREEQRAGRSFSSAPEDSPARGHAAADLRRFLRGRFFVRPPWCKDSFFPHRRFARLGSCCRPDFIWSVFQRRRFLAPVSNFCFASVSCSLLAPVSAATVGVCAQRFAFFSIG